MRFAARGEAWDLGVPAFVLPYAIWTLYVHLVVATQASFTTLLAWLPLVVLVALCATAGWFRLRDPAAPRAADGNAMPDALAAHDPAAMRWPIQLAVLALAMCWVGLLSAGMPYAVFWWGGLVGLGGAWVWSLRGATIGPDAGIPGRRAAWLVPCVIVAAICIVLVAHRPDADDAFHLSIPATLLRFPERAVLLHDTMYRLPGIPILLPFYRLANYDVLAAVFNRATGIDHLVAAYVVLPSLFAATSVLAWVYLLRRVVPGRWPVVLAILFACVLALGETHRAYGNFAFVRLFQGKAILATCMVPVITGAALSYARHGGLRNWLLLLAAEIAALGFSASALFVAPAAAALGLAGGWSADGAHSRRFLAGLLASTYLFAAAWLVSTGVRGEQVLAVASPAPMPGVKEILDGTWGRWSARILLVAMFAAWAFVRHAPGARYFSAGALFFMLVALNPYTVPFLAEHSVGAKTYWRLTWALPLPFFLAVVLDGLFDRARGLGPKVLAVSAVLVLVASSVAFGTRFGTLRHANHVDLAFPGPKVPPLEYGLARRIAEQVPEEGAALAPQAVATWLPIFVVHPEPVGTRHMYLSLAFTPAETAQRSNMMRYVGGRYRRDDAATWFPEALRRHNVTAVVYSGSAPWRREIETILRARGWQPLSCGTYVMFVAEAPAGTHATPIDCGVQPAPSP